jgi:hypothetical protein
MKITLADLDSTLAGRIREHPRFEAVMAANPAATRSSAGAKVLRAVVAVAGMAAAQFALLLLGRPLGQASQVAATVIFFVAMAAPPVAATVWFQKAGRPKRLPPEKLAGLPLGRIEWRVLAGIMILSGAQKTYAEAVTTLLELSESGSMDEPRAREILADLNGLAASDRALIDRQQDLAHLAGVEDAKKLAKERDALAARRDAATDPAARAALEQSLSLLDERVALAAELAPLWERVGAQREVIAQTMASLAGALLRLKVTPTATASGAAADVEETARAIVRQTRAVEAAVQEVVALRGG